MDTPRKPAPDATHTFDQSTLGGDALLGQVVGNFHLLARAGQGANGTVYRARDVRLDRTVAVKFFDGSMDDASHRRFEMEARALARINKHPNVVDIYAWGEHEGRCYLVLEYAPETAASLLARRGEGIPLTDAIRIVRQCAKGLMAAHAAGVIHGDLKPSNILLSEDFEQAKLCDFGLAQLTSDARPLGGSPAYLAPECVAGQPPSVASDIYALGATLRVLAAGAASSGGSTAPVSPNAKPRLPQAVLDILAKAMATDPARRFESAEQFYNALDLREPARKARRNRATPAWRILRLTLAALFIIAAGLGLVIAQGFLPGGAGNGVLLADARLSLNKGDYEAARQGFENYLSQQPENPEARYGLAYAFLLEGDHERAAQEFGQLGESAMREEGKAAIAYMASGEAARPALEQAATQQPQGYAAVLLSMLDMMAGQFDAARKRLDTVSEENLNFDWQRRQYLQTLGQVYFKSGDYGAAEEIFARLEQGEAGPAGGIATDYAALARRRNESMQREDVGERLARLKAMRDVQPEPANGDTWTSRPLRIWIPPVDAGNGIIAQESGLADVLPWRVALALANESRVNITPVERSVEADILAEQELSATLGQPAEAIRLGKVMGARLLLLSKVTRLFGEELLHLTLVDTETTRQIPVGEYAIRRDLKPNEWIATLMDDLAALVLREYPVRALLQRSGDNTFINVGSALGVQTGMIFRARDAHSVEGAALATIARVVDENQSEATLSGFNPDEIPTDGLRVEHVEESNSAP